LLDEEGGIRMVERQKSALTEFKDFVMQGNVIDLAVAVVIGTFFAAVVKDVVNFILTILAIPGKGSKPFSGLTFTIGHGTFQYGTLIEDVITFIVVAAVIFFLVVRPLARMQERRRLATDPDSDNRPCPQCLSEIPKAATRCAYCTADVGVAA
jgi:large conductance mechanosensitive channel